MKGRGAAVPLAALMAAGCGPTGGERDAIRASAVPQVAVTTASEAPRPSDPPAPPAPSPEPPAPSPEPARIDGPKLIEIDVEGHGRAVVAVPVGARAPQPVVLATHGNYDTPDWQCSTWRDIVGPERFVLCPRGVPRPDSPSADDVRFTHPTNAALEVEIEAALAALRARFGDQVAEGPVVYTGFSLGAIMGVAIAARAKHPGRYPAMVLVEGGHDRWTPATARSFADAGGRRVLFACGQPSCLLDAKRAATHLERAGIATRVVGVKDAGHSYGGAVAQEVRAAWPFVTGDDAAPAPGVP